LTEQPKVYTCKVCGATFTRVTDIALHTKKEHPKKKSKSKSEKK